MSDVSSLRYKSFDAWLDEIEVFSTRRERFLEEFGQSGIDWLKAAWGLGEIQSEFTSDGHAAEAAKDVRDAGWPEAADVIERKTLPMSKRIIEMNVRSIADQMGLKPKERSDG